MTSLPENLNAIGNALFGEPTDTVQFYEHKFLRDMDSGPEVGWAMYPVDMLKLAVEGREPNQKVATASRELMRTQRRLCINVSYARSLPIERLRIPAIVITIKHPVTGIVYQDVADGNHRMYAAWLLGHEGYPAVALTLEESDRCRLPDELAKRLRDAPVYNT